MTNYPDCSDWLDDQRVEGYELERVYPVDHGPACQGHYRIRWMSFQYQRDQSEARVARPVPWGLKVKEEYL